MQRTGNVAALAGLGFCVLGWAASLFPWSAEGTPRSSSLVDQLLFLGLALGFGVWGVFGLHRFVDLMGDSEELERRDEELGKKARRD